MIADERDDLLTLVGDILQYNETSAISVACLVNQLLGFLQGISCDDELTDSEIQTLQGLVNREPSAHSHWAVKRIKEKVDAVLDDGVIEEHERESLLDDVKAVCGQGFLDTGIVSGLSTGVLVGDIDFETLADVKVCFTGTTRADMTKDARGVGVDVVKSVTKKLDVLVIGGIASRDWKFSSFGRKVETVHKNRDSGSTTAIIDELTWVALLSRYKQDQGECSEI